MIENEREIFTALNKKLAEKGQTLTFIGVGGYALSHYGIKTTQDVDGFFDRTSLIDSLIEAVGEEFAINPPGELWLNNSVQNFNEKPPESICKTIYEFSNLKIMLPPLEYVAGMKLYSGREQDVSDVAAIITTLKLKSPDKLAARLAAFGFAPVDEALLLEAFGRAWGLKWLERYYITHEASISERIRRQNIYE